MSAGVWSMATEWEISAAVWAREAWERALCYFITEWIMWITARKLPKTDASAASQSRPRGVNLNQEPSQPESGAGGCCKWECLLCHSIARPANRSTFRVCHVTASKWNGELYLLTVPLCLQLQSVQSSVTFGSLSQYFCIALSRCHSDSDSVTCHSDHCHVFPYSIV